MVDGNCSNGHAIAAYIAGAQARLLPAADADMARLCLAEFGRGGVLDEMRAILARL